MQETMTVTALLQMFRRGASRTALERIAGGAHQLHYLDKKYFITRPRPPRTESVDWMIDDEAYQKRMDGLVHMTGR